MVRKQIFVLPGLPGLLAAIYNQADLQSTFQPHGDFPDATSQFDRFPFCGVGPNRDDQDADRLGHRAVVRRSGVTGDLPAKRAD